MALFFCLRVDGQSQELQQLQLDMEKLAQLKLLLSNLQSTTRALTKSYQDILAIGQSNFDLHQQYINGLLQVSPALQAGPVIGRTQALQAQVVSDGRELISALQGAKTFSGAELDQVIQAC
ncbi:MAG: hypothetical protein ACRETL_00805, partial [Gammaproteobacteria bacterium]